MGAVPGPRTHPTVKNLAQTNQRSLRAWQVSLSALQVAMLLGGVLGSLGCMFYLGFFSGQKVGLEMALNNSLAAAMRLPVDFSEEGPLSADESLSEVYARLKQLDVPANTIPQETFPTDRALVADEGATDSIASKSGAAFALNARESFGAFESPEIGSESLSATSSQPSSPLQIDAIKRALDEDSDSASTSRNDGAQLGTTVTGRASLNADKAPAAAIGALRNSERSSDRTSEAVAPKINVAPVISRSDSVASDKASERPRQFDSTDNARVTSKILTAPRDSGSTGTANRPTSLSDAVGSPASAARVSAPELSRSAPSLVRDRLPKGWFAQVGAPDKRGEAESLARSLERSGFAVLIESAKVRGQEYFRVLVGPEDTRQQAERLLAQLKRESVIKADPFIRMVR